MDFRHLRHFVAVAEEGSFRAAARQLGTVQPPLTRSIQALEAELGHDLFVRDTRNVRLTVAGQAFLPEARRTLAQAEIAIQRCQAAARGEFGRLQIGYFGSSIYTFLPTILRRFQRDAEAVEVAMTFMRKIDQVEALRARTLDLRFGHFYSHEPGLVVEVIGRERLFVATPADGPHAGADMLTLQDLRSEPLLLYPREGRPNFSDDVIGLFSDAGLSAQIKYIANDATSVLSMVASLMGSALVPESVLELRWPGVSFKPLEQGRFSVPITCVYRQDGLPAAAEQLLALARAHGSG